VTPTCCMSQFCVSIANTQDNQLMKRKVLFWLWVLEVSAQLGATALGCGEQVAEQSCSCHDLEPKKTKEEEAIIPTPPSRHIPVTYDLPQGPTS
jgi:hypothetical protein